MNIKQGDIIILKPEWMDKGDENITFIASEDLDSSDDRLYMQDRDCQMTIIPTSLVRLSMIQEVISQ